MQTRFKRVRRWLIVNVALLAIWLGTAYCLDRHGRSSEAPPGSYDAIVVMGCRVWSDGEASPALARRARHAVRLWREGRAPHIVFTGGVGDFPPSEAEAGAAVARQEGVPDSAIILERTSTSTEENAQYTLDQLGPDARVLVVTDSYHVLRSELVFRKKFRNADAVGSTGIRSVRVRGAIREVVAVAIYGLAGRLV